jgi:hypothetical protein
MEKETVFKAAGYSFTAELTLISSRVYISNYVYLTVMGWMVIIAILEPSKGALGLHMALSGTAIRWNPT